MAHQNPSDDELALDDGGGLGEGGANGWSPEEMFRKNERDYGVTSTFKENLEGYTVQLDSKNSAEFR